ncbi:hypothetical protein A3A63_00180 [Candidatus Gottesmanbacteria bacterium RIFCSPLOWO2_01_FULL_46_9]|uniref:Uncharacterized protein n=1 Tax=Candidatus Gottesmanbacteria bacterium RIFCSPLOWO2_01_FULL_46_9 TaxID=1798394 RepID=A0A1F6B3Y1_9BACT|nr:MAG: hypothetical protein A3A63_00180 [Candidatus Gottesmanbacteria bacterium RIFCSPLOWO2_01_FULL_46_9]
MNSTISAITQTVPTIDLGKLLQNPFVQYVLSPAIVFAIVLWLAYNLLNLGELKQKFTQSVLDIEDLKKDNKKLLSHVDIIRTHLVTNTGLNANLFGPGSPLKLLPAGIRILNLSGFKQVYATNKTWFIDEIKKIDVKTLSDIDEASIKILEKCRHDNKFANYKEIAFENGISIDTLLKILSIYLRDELAKEVLTQTLKA